MALSAIIVAAFAADRYRRSQMTSDEPRTEVAEVVEPTEEEPITAESLIEEVSIDGMCGVY